MSIPFMVAAEATSPHQVDRDHALDLDIEGLASPGLTTCPVTNHSDERDNSRYEECHLISNSMFSHMTWVISMSWVMRGLRLRCSKVTT